MSTEPEFLPADPDIVFPPQPQNGISEDYLRNPYFAPPPTPRYLPNLLHTVIFFVMALGILLVGGSMTVVVGRLIPAFRHESFATLAGDARLTIPSQAIQYAALVAVTALFFSALWRQPFWPAMQWNASAARKRWIWLVLLGFALGLCTSLIGNYLPMPKEAPILSDMKYTTFGAWLMFLFGTTAAPIVEELAFRGFLLTSLVNAFRSLEASEKLTHQRLVFVGMPVSVLLTTLPFALLHSMQVSHAWAPLFLIGLVSVVLCAVRLRLESLAASTLVHASYNFALFAGLLVASDGFRHLDKLNG